MTKISANHILVKYNTYELSYKMNYLKHQKKSQITLFVIIGLVLLILVIIMLAMRQSIKPKPVTAQNILNELETGRVKNHIVDCALRVTMDGLEKISANGGTIYDFEGGNIPFKDLTLGSDYLNYTHLTKPYFVSYGLKDNALCSEINYASPDYPYTNTSLSELDVIYNENCLFNSFYAAYDGFYGENVMSKLCHPMRASGCEPFAKGANVGFTIQKQLEDYIIKKLPLCVDLTQFSDKTGATLSTEVPPIAELSIHDSDMLLAIKYPIKITYPDKEPVTKVTDYQTTTNIRLGRVYNFIYNLLSLDSKNIEFDIEEEFVSSPYWKSGLEVKRVKDPCTSCSLPYKYDDILEVIDRKSIVNGRPLLFRISIKDRRPALDWMEGREIDVANTQTIEIPLNAHDPDDSKITYYFLSYNFGRSECQGSGTFIIPSEEISSSTTILTGGQGWCEADMRVQASLTYSELWASINQYDSGTHAVGILALDDNGLFDYQQFWINITDSSTNNPPQDNCIGECILEACCNYAKEKEQCNLCGDGKCKPDANDNPCDISKCDFSGVLGSNENPAHDCRGAWCKTAANQCRSFCDPDSYVGWACYPDNGNEQKRSCQSCVYAITHSGDPQAHRDCFSITDKNTCIRKMPDCFWVRQNDTVTNTFVESCYNDTSLSQVSRPAYIITK
ncbi:hypothetical protein JW756_01480 [Candidatus Woesearchaeota archaeon]|nr:hypothetical protein [Candidatus Woesearchaeota archaeon]